MKQKYTLNIADIQLNVIADTSPEEVDKIAGLLDRKMREIFLHSRSVTKNEAALLCAMEFCSERLSVQAKTAELEEVNSKYDEVLRLIRTRNQELMDEVDKLKSENTLLRSLITTKTEEAAQAEAPAEPKTLTPVTPAEFLEQVALAQTDAPARTARPKRRPKPAQEAPAEAVPEETEAAEAPAADAAGDKPRSRVGSMFDLLDFDEV